MCDIVFEKTKCRGGIVNRTNVIAEAAIQREEFFKESVTWISQNSQENIYAGISFLIKLNSVDIQLH